MAVGLWPCSRAQASHFCCLGEACLEGPQAPGAGLVSPSSSSRGMRVKPPFSSEVWGSINAMNRLLPVTRDYPISPELPEPLTKVHEFLKHIPYAVSPALLGMSPDFLPGFKQEMMAQMLWQKRDLGAATPELQLCDSSSILRDWGVGTPHHSCTMLQIPEDLQSPRETPHL